MSTKAKIPPTLPSPSRGEGEEVLQDIALDGVRLFKKGKVRCVFDLDDKLLIVATDRISAFDYVLPNGIPHKGHVLSALSEHWFGLTGDIIANHLISTKSQDFPKAVGRYLDQLQGRSMLVRKTKLLEVECVVRGYLAGSGWKEYQKTQAVCGVQLPAGLKESDQLQEPIFTPSTKAESGHDENITEKQMKEIVGEKWGNQLRDASLAIYKKCAQLALKSGIIIADTKFEFGILDNKLMLIDELLTPDSSRFWPKDSYQPDRSQDSFDKQYVRDYLESIRWNKQPPVPTLPPEVVSKTSEKYLDAYRRITGKEL